MGTPMGFPWDCHGLEVLPLDSHRYTVFPCVTHGTSKGLQCWSTGLTRGAPMGLYYAHGPPMELLWVFHWDSRRASMGFPLGFP